MNIEPFHWENEATAPVKIERMEKDRRKTLPIVGLVFGFLALSAVLLLAFQLYIFYSTEQKNELLETWRKATADESGALRTKMIGYSVGKALAWLLAWGMVPVSFGFSLTSVIVSAVAVILKKYRCGLAVAGLVLGSVALVLTVVFAFNLNTVILQ